MTATNNDTVYEKVIESTTELATETLKPRILFTPGHFILFEHFNEEATTDFFK